MWSRTYFISLLILICSFYGQSQSCEITLEGVVSEEATGIPIASVYVYNKYSNRATFTDEHGYFILNNICPLETEVVFSHLSYNNYSYNAISKSDSIVAIRMRPKISILEPLIITDKRNIVNQQPSLTLQREQIISHINQNLAGLLEKESGIQLIKNGSGISKPIVHGMYGNRLTILNHGLVQSGQQWGNDHSPEIDPFSGDKIIVIKGANAVEYGGANMGSIILVESQKVKRDSFVKGQLNYAFESNGLGQTINGRIEKFSDFAAWRLTGTLRKYGDRKSSNYYLRNTGVEEINGSIQIEKNWKDKLLLDIYLSTFNTTLGVLRGSHIGNISDLNEALNRPEPFYTEDDFSYQIDAPKQQVSHYLGKIRSKYLWNSHQSLELTLAVQRNNRKEFDIRRGNRSDLPSLYLTQYSWHSDTKYAKEYARKWLLKIGNQNVLLDNTNQPETGILPLIPDYRLWRTGYYGSLSKNMNFLDFSVGFRYDYEYQDVVTITKSVPHEIVRYNKDFHNLSGQLSLFHKFLVNQSIRMSAGYTKRNPAINEFYSNGLHQGVSGIEEGNIHLKSEHAFKSTVEYEGKLSSAFQFTALAYFQDIKNYIFLAPQNEIRLTIRGAFPLFKYEQTDARIYGIDLSSYIRLNRLFNSELRYSFIKGIDVQNDIPLVFMPSNNLWMNATYNYYDELIFWEKLKFDNLKISIENKFVFQQKNILNSQDFLAPPASYYLLGINISSDLIINHKTTRVFLKGNNILNSAYRDYLDRQRYFADAEGRSITIGFNSNF